MDKYRKKPLIVEAAQWDGKLIGDLYPIKLFGDNDVEWHYKGKDKLVIETLEGEMICEPGDWVVKGIKGEFYPVAQDIFNESYDKVEE